MWFTGGEHSRRFVELFFGTVFVVGTLESIWTIFIKNKLFPIVPFDHDWIDLYPLRLFHVAYELQNEFRRVRHGVPELEWDPLLATEAMVRAYQLSSRPGCELKPQKTDRYEQNMFSTSRAYNESFELNVGRVAIEAVNHWYKEIANYEYQAPGYHAKTQHFTRMVWASSTSVGFGGAENLNTGCIVIVVNYSPPGNTGSECNGENQYAENVRPFQYISEVKVHKLD